MSEMDRITLHMCICLERSNKPLYHIWRMAKHYRRKTKDKNVKLILNKIIRDPHAISKLREVSDELYPISD
jgi:hypothetical protein